MITVVIVCFFCFLIGYWFCCILLKYQIAFYKKKYKETTQEYTWEQKLSDYTCAKKRILELEEKKLTWSEVLIEAKNGDTDALFARRSVTIIGTHPMYMNLTFEEIYKSLMRKYVNYF